MEDELWLPSGPNDFAQLGGPGEVELTRIVEEAAAALGTPIALVSLIDEQRQWFKAKVGLALSDTPRTVAFCTHTVNGTGVFEVADAARDVRFSRNPLVVGPPHIRFYAGAPLCTANGNKIGSICVIDDQSRAGLSAQQKSYLLMLARRTMVLFASELLLREAEKRHSK